MAKSPFDRNTRYVFRHLGFGWGTLLLFLSLGMVLEAMHAFKIGWYVDESNTARHWMWTLAHTHGTLLALVHIAFAVTLRALPENVRLQRFASPCLLGASVLLPGGFLAGGVVLRGGGPELGFLLVSIGAVLLVAAVLVTALGVRFASSGGAGG